MTAPLHTTVSLCILFYTARDTPQEQGYHLWSCSHLSVKGGPCLVGIRTMGSPSAKIRLSLSSAVLVLVLPDGDQMLKTKLTSSPDLQHEGAQKLSLLSRMVRTIVTIFKRKAPDYVK